MFLWKILQCICLLWCHYCCLRFYGNKIPPSIPPTLEALNFGHLDIGHLIFGQELSGLFLKYLHYKWININLKVGHKKCARGSNSNLNSEINLSIESEKWYGLLKLDNPKSGKINFRNFRNISVWNVCFCLAFIHHLKLSVRWVQIVKQFA